MKSKSKKAVISVIVFIVVAAILVGGYFAVYTYKKSQYKLEYFDLVQKYSTENKVDVYLVYAVIKTESGFNHQAESNQKARGLMQITEPTFDWLKTKIKDDASFDDMYKPEMNIKYGAFFVGYLMKEFGTVNEAMAAYHAGRGRVLDWLSNKQYSSDGMTLDTIPVSETAHYVTKINKNYSEYKKMYGGK